MSDTVGTSNTKFLTILTATVAYHVTDTRILTNHTFEVGATADDAVASFQFFGKRKWSIYAMALLVEAGNCRRRVEWVNGPLYLNDLAFGTLFRFWNKISED